MPQLQRACAEARRVEFPRLGPGAYLNAASVGPLPERTLAALRASDERRAGGTLGIADFTEPVVRARAACARLVGAADEEVALTPNTSVGINIAAAILRQKAGGRRTVLMPDGEFPANVYGWLALERHGFRVERAPLDASGCPCEDALIRRLDRGDVCALTISAVQFATGYRADLAALGAACSARDVLFVVDAIQALGVSPLDVKDAHIDILASGGQKWLCAPFGTGFVYVRRDLAVDTEPEFPGWLSFESSADFARLLEYDRELWPDARRFEVGSLAVSAFDGLARSIELLLEVGVDVIADHVAALHEPLLEWARSTRYATPLVLDPRRRAGILSLRLPDAGSVHAALAAAGVVTVPREGAVRFAPHFYNTAAEIDVAVDVLRSTVP